MERGAIVGGLLISASVLSAILLDRWALQEASLPAHKSPVPVTAEAPPACEQPGTRPCPGAVREDLQTC